MEPEFRFCTSDDGTRIAYAVYGSGPPLLYFPSYFLSMDARFTLPEGRAYFDALAASTTLVTFDRRGTGASARDVGDLSYEAQSRDMAAVADAVGLRGFPLFAEVPYFGEVSARVERLILWLPHTAVAVRQLARAARENWSYARRVYAGMIYPDGPGSLQRAISSAMKDTLSHETAAQLWEMFAEADLDVLWPAVTAPALVLAREQMTALKQGNMRVAGLLPEGNIRFLPGSAGSPYPEHEPVVEAVLGFLGMGMPVPPKRGDASSSSSSVQTILFTDLASSTALTQRLGDAKAQELVRAHNTIVREALASCGGSEIKHTGDGIMASFGSASGALDCAIAVQRAAAQRDNPDLQVYIGLNAGEPVSEDSDLFGTSVQLARRICDQADAGQVLVSNVVRELAAGKGFLFSDTGEVALKGFEEPVRLFEVRWNAD
jgi:class 3 adenylate cyclase